MNVVESIRESIRKQAQARLAERRIRLVDILAVAKRTGRPCS